MCPTPFAHPNHVRTFDHGYHAFPTAREKYWSPVRVSLGLWILGRFAERTVLVFNLGFWSLHDSGTYGQPDRDSRLPRGGRIIVEPRSFARNRTRLLHWVRLKSEEHTF
jgi:hypothetical protein